ncbi:hypothetical protein Tcan_15713 [Toxocara canis]|uniref:Secreted protein n=1 Tax=Toxocara canis TaxID=6265 RepID=A0A0B2VR46_TOXCA|nr:hypothetical protein Tcan_15713 [Toxocara canis]
MASHGLPCIPVLGLLCMPALGLPCNSRLSTKTRSLIIMSLPALVCLYGHRLISTRLLLISSLPALVCLSTLVCHIHQPSWQVLRHQHSWTQSDGHPVHNSGISGRTLRKRTVVFSSGFIEMAFDYRTMRGKLSEIG